MSKFKVGDNVCIVCYDEELNLGWCKSTIGKTYKVLEITGAGDYELENNYIYKEKELELVKEPKPFNLEEFKSGVTALTHDGKVATFISDNSSIMEFEVSGSVQKTYSSGIGYINGTWKPYFVSMIEQECEQEVKVAQPTKSLDEKRYEWFKTYLLSGITINSLENELVDCNSSQEFDVVIDKYSVKISFNKD